MQTSLGSLQLQKACGAERGRGTCKPGMSRELRKDEKAGTGGRGALPNSGGMCKPGFAKYKSGDLKGRRGEAIQSSWEGVKPQRDEEIAAGGGMHAQDFAERSDVNVDALQVGMEPWYGRAGRERGAVPGKGGGTSPKPGPGPGG